MTEMIWPAFRYVLIMIGGVMVGYGWINAEDVEPLADKVLEIAGAMISLGAAAWGLWTLFRTKRVPASVVKELGLPVVSPATGKVV